MNKLILLLLTFGFFLSCGNDEISQPNNFDCGQKAIVDSTLFVDAPNDEFDFVKVEINGDCMEITISYGGGCGEIELELIGSDVIIETLPAQRHIRLSLKDEDICKALLRKEISFDLTPFRLLNDNKVLLPLTGWNELILYQY